MIAGPRRLSLCRALRRRESILETSGQSMFVSGREGQSFRNEMRRKVNSVRSGRQWVVILNERMSLMVRRGAMMEWGSGRESMPCHGVFRGESLKFHEHICIEIEVWMFSPGNHARQSRPG